MKPLEIKIPIPNGYQYDHVDIDSSEVILLEKPKKIKDRIKTVEDILEHNGISQEESKKKLNALQSMELEHLYWQWIAELLAKSLNQGWVPDWSNSNEYKYFPWFEMKSSSGFRFYDCANWASYSAVGSRLAFKSSDYAKYAGTQFEEVYKKFMTQ